MSRRSLRRPPNALVAVAAVGVLAGVAVLPGLVELPDIGGLLEDLTTSIGTWAYLLVPVLAFLETGAFVGLVVPGETAVLVGGVVAERGDVALVPLIGLVWLGSVTGDLVSFLIGRRLGCPFLERHGRRVGIGDAQLVRVERFFARYGGRAVVLARFVGVLRALTPFVAGASGYPVWRFIRFSIAGTFVWATTFTLIGFLFSASFSRAGSTVTLVLLAVAFVGAVASLLVGRAAPQGSPRDVPRRVAHLVRRRPKPGPGADEAAGADSRMSSIDVRDLHPTPAGRRPRTGDRRAGHGDDRGGRARRRLRSTVAT